MASPLTCIVLLRQSSAEVKDLVGPEACVASIERTLRRRLKLAGGRTKWSGDAVNAVSAAAGYNFRRLLVWLAMIWCVSIEVIALITDAYPA